MYIDKWWGNITCGDTDDSILLMDYFIMKNEDELAFSGIIKDAQLGGVFGKIPLYESKEIDCFFGWIAQNI